MTACDNCEAPADAPTCTQHPTCVACYDPRLVSCLGCNEAAGDIAWDREQERRYEADRDQR